VEVRTGFEPAYNGFAKRIAFFGVREVHFFSGESLYRAFGISACPGAVPIGFSNRCSGYVGRACFIQNMRQVTGHRVAEIKRALAGVT